MHWIPILLITNIVCLSLFILLFLNYEATQRKLKNLQKVLKNNEDYKEELLAELSHNLRTPLNAIMGYTSLMLNNVHGQINQKQRNDLKKVSGCADKILTIIQKQLSD